MMKKIKKYVWAYIHFVQKILLFIFLTIIYFLGFGITKFFVFIFRIKLFDQKKSSDQSFFADVITQPDKKSFFSQV